MTDLVDAVRIAGRQVGRLLSKIQRRVPPGVRSVLGLFLIAGGVVGFLPVFGFWMIPLGIAVIGLDVAPFWRRWKSHAGTVSGEADQATSDKASDSSK